MDLEEIYNYLFVELSVPETRDWLFISSPYPLILIVFGYMYFVLFAGPRYMKDRLPYKLRTFILIYNIIQILANAWFIKMHIDMGWLSKEYYITCERRKTLDVTKMLYFAWWGIFLKAFDFIETCIFVLRKKQNQVSALHVYHHISNFTFVWYYSKYCLDERASFISLINCAIHVIMYIYYFIAALSPDLQRMISPIKPIITKLQMVQFITMLVFLIQLVNPNCKFQNRGLVFMFIGNLFIFLYLFYDFYKKTYTLKQKNE